MKYYKKIFGWENIRRIEGLLKFRELLIDYYSNTEFGYLTDEPAENQTAQKARIEINRKLHDIQKILMSCGITATVYYSPPPAIGGLAGELNLMSNLFQLYRFRIPPQQVLDCIERAVGMYESDTIKSWLRIANPFFYVSFLLDYIAQLPFILVGKAGFNQNAAEESIVGKFVKLLVQIVTVTASLLTILHLTGQLDRTLKLLKDFMKKYL